MGILMIFISTAVLAIRPEERRKQSRDHKRLSDMQLLDRLINEYVTDFGFYPDEADAVRDSITLPENNLDLASSTAGWINADFSKYNSKLPLDPLNESSYIYSYVHNGNSYELNALLESMPDKASGDGGNDSNVYELGNNLELISP